MGGMSSHREDHMKAPIAERLLTHLSLASRLATPLLLLLFSEVGCGVAPRTGKSSAPVDPLSASPRSNFQRLLARNGPGIWYLNASGEHLTLQLDWNAVAKRIEGSIVSEADGGMGLVDQIGFDSHTNTIELRRATTEGFDWYRARVTENVLVGRLARVTSPDRPGDPDYALHLSGWSESFDAHHEPRVWDVVVDGEALVRIRIDRAPDHPTGFIGRWKIYASMSQGSQGEQVERDLEVTLWDGTNLAFVSHDPDGDLKVTATATGRLLSGTILQGTGDSHPFQGARADVLGFGLSARSSGERDQWQRRTRRQLELLLMNGAPSPTSHNVEVLTRQITPTRSELPAVDRDDDARHWPQNYDLAELGFTSTLLDPAGGPDLTRTAHGFLATPQGGAPTHGRPAVLAVNGHEGSAAQLFQPDNIDYWYGDAFARRGYTVLALDISHRPLEDRSSLYVDFLDGDDYARGNGLHPAIKSTGFDSDWEEDGERVWDVMRALDYLRRVPGVDPNRIIVTGLSMGGEVTTLAAALDPRFAAAVVAGFSPDLGTMLYNGNHPCWLWQNKDLREYIDSSDLQALIAPRPLVVETGRVDAIFSAFYAPFAADKQVARRARLAYADHPEHYLHYLHYDIHHYHVGDLDPEREIEEGLREPVVTAPTTPWSTDWQTDPATRQVGSNLFAFLGEMLK